MDKYSKHFLLNVNTAKEYAVEKVGYFKEDEKLEAIEIGDGNINYVFKVRNPETGKSLIIKQADGTYIVDGMTQLEDLEELLGISFNEEDYDTIYGYLSDCLDRIPSEDEECQVEFGGYLFHVLSVDNNTIRKVLVSRTKK